MSRIAYEQMTKGQLTLEYAAKCQWHQCDGVKALAIAGKASEPELRIAMLAYRKAARKKDWGAAETALLSIADPVTAA